MVPLPEGIYSDSLALPFPLSWHTFLVYIETSTVHIFLSKNSFLYLSIPSLHRVGVGDVVVALVDGRALSLLGAEEEGGVEGRLLAARAHHHVGEQVPDAHVVGACEGGAD